MALSHFSLACLLAILPGPPGILFEDAYLQLYPVDTTKCGKHNLGRDITFELYTKHNPIRGQELRVGDDNLLSKSYMDFSLPTVIFFHAFFESSTSDSATIIREAYIIRGGYNIILISARRLYAGPWYPSAVRNTHTTGLYAAQFVEFLYGRGLKPSMLHLIGLSLGGQTAGVVGGALSRRPARITGLDPALPLYAKLPLNRRLDRNDADFVDIIHTDAGGFGISAAMGHADFYVNGGLSPQPGCELEYLRPRMMLLEKFFCSHWRSYQLYAESILRPGAYPSVTCSSNKSCKNLNKDLSGPYTYMGFAANPEATGRFFVRTSATYPYNYY